MIYFLDNSLQLQKIVTSKNVISAIHEHELNGLIRADVELDLSYANKFLLLGIDHVGYYYKDDFYLHKIQRVEYDHVNESAKVVLRHIFFEDMIFGKLIQDVRPQNQDALTVSRQTIDANTRWQTIMTDVTGRLSTNFYWQVPYEVIEFMTENYRIEYLPKILFDGKKINGFQLHLANKIGEDKNIRIPYGSRVLDLKYEEDYSEIITKLVVHGKGEEVGDGYGRRINISDVNFSRNGVESPVGSLYLEDETITNTYGNDGQTPREGREVFEDIEDANELAEVGYQHYLQVSRPQMLFTADVVDIGDVGIGDSVMIIRREYDVYFNARIHKLSVDLLYPEDAQVELGDYKHFKESKVARKSREKNNRVQGQLSDRITRLKLEANERFDNEVAQWKSEYEQALIDVHAQIEADRENMTNLIEGTRTEWTESFDASVAEAHRLREENYAAMSDYVNTTVDTTRSDLESSIASNIAEAERIAQLEHEAIRGTITSTISATRTALEKKITDSIEEAERIAQLEHEAIEQRVTDTVDTTRENLETNINASIESAKQYAEQQATEKSNAVKTTLESVTDRHQGMLDGLQDNVMDIDDFLGDKSLSLDWHLNNVRDEMHDVIAAINQSNPNLIVGTTLEDTAHLTTWGTSQVELNTVESLNFIRVLEDNVRTNAGYSYPSETSLFNGRTYTLAFDYRSFGVTELDYSYFLNENGNVAIHFGNTVNLVNLSGLVADGKWRRYYRTFTFTGETRSDYALLLGTWYERGSTARGFFDTRQVMVYEGTVQVPWQPAPQDNRQVITQLSREIYELQDGMSSLATKTEFDILTGDFTQFTNEYIETAETVSLTLQEHDNWFVSNGSNLLRTAEEVSQKVWMSDIHNPNLIPFSHLENPDNFSKWTGRPGTVFFGTYLDYMIIRDSNSGVTIGAQSPYIAEYVVPGEKYTLSWEANFSSNSPQVNTTFNYMYIMRPSLGNVRIPIPKRTALTSNRFKYEITFTMSEIDPFMSILFGTYTTENTDSFFRLRYPKLELGSIATPYNNAFSGLTQRADEMLLAVQGIGAQGYLNQSDIKIIPDHVQIGSQRIDGSNIGSLLRVSPTGIDMVAEAMRLSGDLYVDGDITSLAVNAARGDIAYLRTNILTADSINATHIESESIGASQIRADSVLINKLFANSFAAGHISTTALEAVEGEFASLFAAQLSATTITAEHIGSKSITVDEIVVNDALVETIVARSVFAEDITSRIGNFIDLNVGTIRSSILTANTIETSMLKASVVTSAKIKVDDVLVNRIIAQSVYANDVTSKIGNFIDLNAGNIVTAGLSANVITSDHIQVGTALVDKMFATSARIDELITKTHFVNEMHALTLNVVELNASHIRSRLITTNTIEAEWLKSGTALLDRVFSTTAMFGRMFAKTGFITSFSSVTISADQITNGILRAPNDAFYLNLNSGAMYFRSGANIRFYNEGIAMQHSKSSWTVGMAFESHPRSASAPAVWLGGNSSSSVIADHSSFTGIWAMPQNNEVDISGRHIRIRSFSGYTQAGERILNIKMDESSRLEFYPSNTTNVRYHFGRDTSKWWDVWTQNLNRMRLVDETNVQALRFGEHGIEFGGPNGITFIKGGERYSLDYVMNRF